MNRIAALLIFVLISARICAQQPPQGQSPDAEPIFFEVLQNGKTRFYYDDRYYLADKNCPYKAIERIGYYDFAQKQFEGLVEDFDYNGQLVLTGNYVQGKKQGTFQAFHSNGNIKWQVDFKADLPTGPWQHFYPDGKPMLTTVHSSSGIEIREYWDTRGRHRVKDGRGRFEMKVEVDGYSEYGAVFVNNNGSIRNGKPHGIWNVSFVYEDQQIEYVGSQTFVNGELRNDPQGVLNLIPEGATRLSLAPIPWFVRGEQMIGKACNIDEYSGFTEYLSLHLEEWFDGLFSTDIEINRVEYDIAVNKQGIATKIEAVQLPDDVQFERMLKQALEAVNFWYPTFRDGEFIDDTIRLDFEIFPDNESARFRFFDVRIKRSNGF